MKRLCITLALLSSLFVFAAAGCDMPPGAGRADPILRENYPRIVALEDLDHILAFSPADVRGGDGSVPLSVSVPARVKSNDDYEVQYRFEFFDKGGRPIRPNMEWRYLKMPARAQVFMEGAAVDTNAADWRLLVRPSKMSDKD
ncbi:MAG: DUF1425 domain-containing protein [Planctomycetes bacterium]|nr:DUF1425 domain-containing protein [Planctomycetota bacterium]